MTSPVMAAALNGNFEIVLPRKADRRNNIGSRRAPYDDAWASIKTTVPDLARRIILGVTRQDQRTTELGTKRL